MGVLSAAATKCVGITPWLPRPPWWQLNGTMRKIRVRPIVWWHGAISQLIGTVMLVTMSGVPKSLPELASGKLAACNALKLQGPQKGSSTRPLQRTLSCWHSGITSAMQSRDTFLTKSGGQAPSRSSGCATSARQDSSTAGLHNHLAETVSRRQVVHAVLGMWRANATLCKLFILA